MNDTKTILALAKAISAVAHPLLMPAFSLVMLYVFDGFLVHRPDDALPSGCRSDVRGIYPMTFLFVRV